MYQISPHYSRLLAAAILLLASSALQAGRLLTLADVTGRQLAADGLAALRPMQDGRSFSRISDDGRQVLRCSFADGSTQEVLFDAHKADSIDHVDDYLISPDGRKLLIQTASKPIYRHSLTAVFYVFDIASGSSTPLSAHGRQQVPVWSPDSRRIAFVRDNDIWLSTIEPTDGGLKASNEQRVTADGLFNHILNGIPDWVNEEEFATDRSLTFTADGRHLVWVRYDESHVRQYSMPIFKGLKPEREEYAGYPGFYTYKYPIAGEDNAAVSLWSYDLESGRRRQIDLPLDADGYLPRLLSIPGSAQVAVVTLNRRQNHFSLYACQPEDGSCRLLISEHADAYVKEETYTALQITPRHILLPSDRDGYLHLYIYTHDGKLQRHVDCGPYEMSELYGCDDQTGDVYYSSHEPPQTDLPAASFGNAAERYVWMARKNGKRQCLTPVAGWSSAQFSADFRYFIHTWSDIDTPPVYTLCDRKGRKLKTLVDNSQLRERLQPYDLGRRQLFTLTTQEGVVLNGWMVQPKDFDPAKRYPVVMYQYGGPGNQQVANRWNIGMAGRGALMEQYLCQQGYVCVCVDNRGTGGRGADFEKCTYLRLGQAESSDQVETALWLSRQPWADAGRIAIWGWSFGGFNTLMAMSDGRDVFRCGIAIAPPTSWRYYDTIYTERFMRTPRENSAGYDESPIGRASKLNGALLLCHGMADDNVHFRNTAEYTEALVQADKDFRQLVYTNRNHSIFGGNTRRHLFRQCINFFNEHLSAD